MCFISVTLLAEKPKLPEKKYYIDTNYIHLPKENMEIINPVKDGMSKYKEETVVLHNSPSYSWMLSCQAFEQSETKGDLVTIFDTNISAFKISYFVIMLTRYWSLTQQGHLQPHSKLKAWQLSTQL